MLTLVFSHFDIYCSRYQRQPVKKNALGDSCLNSLPNDKIFDWFKLKAFADDKINVNGKFKFGLGRVENIVRKGENAGYQHFLLFPQCFQKPSVSGSLKVGIV